MVADDTQQEATTEADVAPFRLNIDDSALVVYDESAYFDPGALAIFAPPTTLSLVPPVVESATDVPLVRPAPLAVGEAMTLDRAQHILDFYDDRITRTINERLEELNLSDNGVQPEDVEIQRLEVENLLRWGMGQPYLRGACDGSIILAYLRWYDPAEDVDFVQTIELYWDSGVVA